MKLARSRLSDIVWKLAAVAVAYGIWLSVIEEKQALRQLEIPVRFEALAAGLALAGDRPSSILVRVQAAEGIAKELQPPDVEARIDLSGLREGTHSIRLPPESRVIIPRKPGIRVVEVFPSALRIQIEKKATADIPLGVAFTGEPLDGYEVAEYHVVPDHVRVVGPQSAVATTMRASTREVALDGLREPFKREVWVDVDNPDVQLQSTPTAQLTVVIRERTVERVFDEVPVVAVNGEFESHVRPESVALTLRGPERLMTQLTEADLFAFVDLKGMAPQAAPYELKVQIRLEREQLRGRVEVLKINRESVNVQIIARRLARSNGPGS